MMRGVNALQAIHKRLINRVFSRVAPLLIVYVCVHFGIGI